MDIKRLAKDHLKDSYVMQLSTSRDNQPWVCNVHFLADDDLNLYWMSDPAVRHSQEIAANQHVAAAMAIHIEMPLIGIQIAGKAELLPFEGNDAVLANYAERHDRGDMIRDAQDGKSPFKLYRLAPSLVQVFDLKDFPHDPIQQWRA